MAKAKTPKSSWCQSTTYQSNSKKKPIFYATKPSTSLFRKMRPSMISYRITTRWEALSTLKMTKCRSTKPGKYISIRIIVPIDYWTITIFLRERWLKIEGPKNFTSFVRETAIDSENSFLSTVPYYMKLNINFIILLLHRNLLYLFSHPFYDLYIFIVYHNMYGIQLYTRGKDHSSLLFLLL